MPSDKLDNASAELHGQWDNSGNLRGAPEQNPPIDEMDIMFSGDHNANFSSVPVSQPPANKKGKEIKNSRTGEGWVQLSANY